MRGRTQVRNPNAVLNALIRKKKNGKEDTRNAVRMREPGFVPDVAALRLQQNLGQEDRAVVLRQLNTFCGRSKNRNPNALLTTLLRGVQK